MAEKVLMPQLGESVVEGTIVKWLVEAGDEVRKYDPLCEVMTDKVNAEIPSSFNGVVSKIVAQEDETVSVGDLICYIASEDQVKETTNNQPPEQMIESALKSNVTEHAERDEGRQRYSPAVLKLAQEHQLDLSVIKGSGAGGRITRTDVLEYVKRKPEVQKEMTNTNNIKHVATGSLALNSGLSSNSLNGDQGDKVIPVTGVRKAIANKMVESKHNAPHAWTIVECDVTDLVTFRNRVKEEFKQREGINITYLPFFIKAVVEALKDFPSLNSEWAGDNIIIKKDINISIAVGTKDALYVPVIKQADSKSILGLAKSINQLVQKVKEGRLTQDDMSGGTFTINNTGAFGSVISYPIINYPQAAILSVEAIVKRPVVIDGMIAIRDMMNICLSFDHRVVDGLVCGQFLQAVKSNIERYGEETTIY